jgi:PAS domain S-box-containing protein
MIDFQTMMGDSPNPYMVLDREMRFVWANEAYLQATMRRFEDIDGEVLFEAFPPPDEATGQQLRDSIQRALDTGEADELALIEYAIRNPDGSMGHQIWSATHTPFRNGAGEVAYVLQHTVDVTELETLRRLRDEAGVMGRARAVEQRFLDMAEEIAQLRDLLEQAPGFMAVVTGADHRFMFTNAAYRRLLGQRQLVGKTVVEAVPEIEEQGLIATLNRIFTSGEPYFGRRQKVALMHEGATAPRESYLEFILQPIKDTTGQTWGIFVQGHDVTEAVEAEDRQRLLINELNHRVKNTLAVVQGLAQQSFGREPTDGRFEVFGARLGALAGAHTLLTAATWEAADLLELVRGSLEATAGRDLARCTLAGPLVTIPPQLAVTLAMIIHELSTNAIKYGALSTDEGTVTVQWSVARGREATELVIDWREAGGPAVAEPTREGFGARLIRRGLGGQGRAELDYDPAGVHCHIEATL